VCADPQGAAFGILQPLPMEAPPEHPAFDQVAPGHGSWHELMSTDPVAALAFYSDLFGWTPGGEAMDMGEMGTYQVFDFHGKDVGGMMGLGNSPVPMWMPYFGVDGVQDAHDRVIAAGGAVHHGPADVPGGSLIVIATDPQGAWFALVGAAPASA
jgi:predicted enzyme related to lactoylglutathione lyase